MQMSVSRHSSGISMELTASLTSCTTGSGVLAVATCTGGDSCGSICELGDVASTIDSALSEAVVVSVAVPVNDAAAVATSDLATVALPISVACGASAISASAVRDAARRSSISATPVFSVPAGPKPASQATIQPART